MELATVETCAGIAPEAHKEAHAYKAQCTVAAPFMGAQVNIRTPLSEVLQRKAIPQSPSNAPGCKARTLQPEALSPAAGGK